MEQKRKSIFDILLISRKKTKETTQGNGNTINKRIKIIALSIIIMESIFIMLDKTKWNPDINLWELIAKFIIYDFLISIGFIFVCGIMLQIFFFIQTMMHTTECVICRLHWKNLKSSNFHLITRRFLSMMPSAHLGQERNGITILYIMKI